MRLNQNDRPMDDDEINAVKLDIIIDSEAFRDRSHPKHKIAFNEFLICHEKLSSMAADRKNLGG